MALHWLGFIEVTPGIEKGRKKVMTAMEICRNGFLRLRYPRSLMPMYVALCCVCGVQCLMRRKYSNYAK